MILIADIQAEVARAFGIPVRTMTEPSGWFNPNEVSHPRQVAMYLATELTSHSLPRIGHFFGGRDHSTVIFAARTVEKRIENDSALAAKVKEIREKLNPELELAA